MADFTPQRTGELIRKVFQILWYHPDGLPIQGICAQIASSSWLTEHEYEDDPEFNIPRYEHAIWLGLLPFEKAGWLVRKRDRWSISEEGRQACKRFSSATEFCLEATRLQQEWQQDISSLTLVTEIAEGMAWKQLQKYLLSMNRHEFLTLVSDLMQAMEYRISWVAPPDKTRGQIDMIAFTDPLGVNKPRIKVHIQHAGQATLMEGVRSFASTLSSGDVGLFVSSGGFTNSAYELANERTDAQLTLMDLEDFLDLWIDYYKALSEEAHRRLPLKPVHFLAS
jgi:restriction system protein